MKTIAEGLFVMLVLCLLPAIVIVFVASIAARVLTGAATIGWEAVDALWGKSND